MIARFFTEDFRGNKVEHVLECTGAEYAVSSMDDINCKRLTMETDRNYYTCDGVEKEYADKVLDAAFDGKNVQLPEDYIFMVNAKDAM